MSHGVHGVLKAVNLLMNKNFDLRICSLCQANEVENECHVMFSCTLYETLLSKFFDETITKYNFFDDLDVKSKILFLFNNIDPFICKSVTAFLFEIMNCRHDHVISKVTKPINYTYLLFLRE